MRERIQNAFDDIRADDALITCTQAYLQERRARREGRASRLRPGRIAALAAAMLVLTVGLLGYGMFYSTAMAYVGIDVNPSLELALNRMDRVIAANAYNAQGEAILRQAAVQGKPYDEAISLLLAEMERQGYLLGDAFVTLTVQAADGAKERGLCDALLQSEGGWRDAVQSPAELEVFPITQAVRETAHGYHMSAAKYLAIQELMEVDETATLEAYGDSSIGQIRRRTQACRDGHDGGSGQESHSGGQGRGNGSFGGGDEPEEKSEQEQGDGPNQGGGHGGGHRNGHGRAH